MTLFFCFIVIHFIGDWICQSREVAINKKTSNVHLMRHIKMDIVPMLGLMSFILLITGTSFLGIMFFFLTNLGSHYFIDKNLPTSDNPRDLINLTAIDQMLHIFFIYITLILI